MDKFFFFSSTLFAIKVERGWERKRERVKMFEVYLKKNIKKWFLSLTIVEHEHAFRVVEEPWTSNTSCNTELQKKKEYNCDVTVD